LIAWQTVFKLG